MLHRELAAASLVLLSTRSIRRWSQGADLGYVKDRPSYAELAEPAKVLGVSAGS